MATIGLLILEERNHRTAVYEYLSNDLKDGTDMYRESGFEYRKNRDS